MAGSRGKGIERILRSEEEGSEDNKVKPTKYCLMKQEGWSRKWEYNGGSELVQDIPYTCRELGPRCGRKGAL
jgi:hypothetical protein